MVHNLPALQPSLESFGIFSDVMNQSRQVALFCCVKLCGVTHGKFSRAMKMFRNGLCPSILRNMGKKAAIHYITPYLKHLFYSYRHYTTVL